MLVNSIEWTGEMVLLLDQTRLPSEEVVLEINDYRAMIEAIKSLRIRGAPALGIAAAYGSVLAARTLADERDRDTFLKRLDTSIDEIVESRPTAVNMEWAAARMRRAVPPHADIPGILESLEREAELILSEDVETNRTMGAHGAALLPDHGAVLTHCNAGALATAGYGTALGVLRAGRERGKDIRVFATETRPLLQGARLTTWELARDGFDPTLITDSMVGYFLKAGDIDCVILGADRIAMNGDVANKIGTYTIAVLAKENGVPFYVAAPTSTVDPALPSGKEIPIEHRAPEEVTRFRSERTAPAGVRAANPAFDVTPHRYVSAIVTEKGVATPPYTESLKLMLEPKGADGVSTS